MRQVWYISLDACQHCDSSFLKGKGLAHYASLPKDKC